MQTSLTTRIGLAAIVAATTVAVTACGRDGAVAAADADATAEGVTRQWSQAFAAGDAVKLASLYTDDARSIPPGGPPLIGRTAIEQYWRDDIGRGGVGTTLRPSDAFVAGDVLHTAGAYEVAGAGDAVLARGRYQQVWTRVDGEWRLHREMWRLEPGLQRNSEIADRLAAMWTTAYNAADAAALGALYDQDAQVSTAGEGTFIGQPHIQTFWARDFGGRKPMSTLTVTDVYAGGDFMHLEGEYRVVDGARTTDGRYIQLWMRDGGEWRIHREMWWQ